MFRQWAINQFHWLSTNYYPVKLVIWRKGQNLGKSEETISCPVCHHPHLHYLDDENCVSCGCDGVHRVTN